MAVNIKAQQSMALYRPVINPTGVPSQFHHFGINVGDKVYLSVHLTIDADPDTIEYFEGRPVWHCSVGIQPDPDAIGALPVVYWTKLHHTLASHVMQKIVLHGVGEPDEQDSVEVGLKAMHIRRRLTLDEMEKCNYVQD